MSTGDAIEDTISFRFGFSDFLILSCLGTIDPISNLQSCRPFCWKLEQLGPQSAVCCQTGKRPGPGAGEIINKKGGGGAGAAVFSKSRLFLVMLTSPCTFISRAAFLAAPCLQYSTVLFCFWNGFKIYFPSQNHKKIETESCYGKSYPSMWLLWKVVCRFRFSAFFSGRRIAYSIFLRRFRSLKYFDPTVPRMTKFRLLMVSSC